MIEEVEIPHTHLTLSCIKDYDGIAEWKRKRDLLNRPNIQLNQIMHTNMRDDDYLDDDASAIVGAGSIVITLVLGFLFGWFMGRGF